MARLWILLAALALAGCAEVKPFHPVQNREDPDGPGLFSGKGGKIILYESPDAEVGEDQ
ncbi:MAG: hypothetical protein AAF495_02285 [Pseudomonadota bacterium]